MTMPPKSSRRDFLRGKAAAEVLQNVAAELSDHAGDAFGGLTFGASDRESTGYLLRFGRARWHASSRFCSTPVSIPTGR